MQPPKNKQKKVIEIKQGFPSDLLVGLHDVIPESCLFTIVPPPAAVQSKQQSCPLASTSIDMPSSPSVTTSPPPPPLPPPAQPTCGLSPPLTELYSSEHKGPGMDENRSQQI